jgi:antitoxin (DNA-binding transcriptional repressor) of toxin-antitoxin stability system
MAKLDLDDLPPKIAALLSGLAEGEELVLTQHGAVVSRLTVGAVAPPAPSVALVEPDQNAREVFENFRAAIEDEF